VLSFDLVGGTDQVYSQTLAFLTVAEILEEQLNDNLWIQAAPCQQAEVCPAND
jgi:hypothetical protein